MKPDTRASLLAIGLNDAQIDAIDRSKRRLDEKLADTAVRCHGLTQAQRDAFLAAIEVLPATGPKGEPIRVYDIGMAAAEAAR